MIICGIDEAGRGPVIGPMVLCGFCVEGKDEHKLLDLGTKDSKLLSPKKREELFSILKKIAIKYEVVVLSPREIDYALNDPSLNLNWLEAIASAKIANKLTPDKLIIDLPSNNKDAYLNYLKRLLINEPIIIAEHKADVNYPSVSAASIIAKVTRDKEIEKLKKRLGIDFGSGYPSDPKTIDFLKKNFNKYPDIFRKTWACFKKLNAKEAQSKLPGFSDSLGQGPKLGVYKTPFHKH